MSFRTFAIIWSFFNVALFITVTIQNWILYRRLRSNAWIFELIGWTTLLVDMTLGVILALTSPEPIDAGTEISTRDIVRTVLWLGGNTIFFGCLVIARFLLYTYFNQLLIKLKHNTGDLEPSGDGK